MSQSEALNIPLIRKERSFDHTYESHLKSIISDLKKQGVDTGIFGDIHLEEHREWIERVCKDMTITPIFPLWGHDTSSILEDLVHNGFRTIVVAVKNQPKLSTFIGRELDNDLISELKTDTAELIYAQSMESITHSYLIHLYMISLYQSFLQNIL